MRLFFRLGLALALALAAAGASAAAEGASAPASAPAIPFKHESAGAGASLAGGATGVLVLSLLAIGAVLVVRRRLNLQPRAAGGARLLQILETQRLGPRTLLSVVEFGGARYLVAQSEHGVSCLASAPSESAP